MVAYNMLEIRSIVRGSPADCGRFAVGDKLISINGHEINDFIDYRYHQAAAILKIILCRGEKQSVFRIIKNIDHDLGLEFKPDRIIRCRNKCRFCFVNNNAAGMRRSLYLKDDDYRLSFLHGNYITLTNLSDSDLRRIIEMRLSPLYVSVHATDARARTRLFNRADLQPLIPLLRNLAEGGIRMHCQVVVVPGINDGEVLKTTARDLAELRPAVQSLAVVPVGLTKYAFSRKRGKFPLRLVKSSEARRLIAAVAEFRRKFGNRHNGFAYASDEMFLLAGIPIPKRSYYDEFPQIENGVGMVRRFIDSIPPVAKRRVNALAVTGRSMLPFWKEKIIRGAGNTLKAVAVDNRFWGKSVTVTGLLTGADILSRLKKMRKGPPVVILPPNCLNDDDRFIDDYSMEDLSTGLGKQVVRGSYDLSETLDMLR